MRRVKFTIALCALLVLALGASQAYAQGFAVSKSIETVVQHGKNQMVGQIQLNYDADGGDLDAGETITITFGGLPIATLGTPSCEGGTSIDCENDDAEFENDPDTGAGTLTIKPVRESNFDTNGSLVGLMINLRGTRVDVSSLDAGDEIIATISSTAPTGLIPISQSRRSTVSTVVAEVMPGLEVKIDAASRLICNLEATYDHDGDGGGGNGTAEIPVGGVPMITVSEGFDDAWEGKDVVGALGGTVITIATDNLPEGVELRFPPTVTFSNPDDADVPWATLTLSGANADNVNLDATDDAEDNTDNGSMVTYDYSIESAGTNEVGDVMDSFSIPITVVTGDIASGDGGVADIWAILSPEPDDDDEDIGTRLSYVKTAVTDKESGDGTGDFLNIAECVTYLLFPYITCGAHADWDTGIAIANTTMDDNIFGLSAGATPQRGSVTMYAFPTSEKTADDYSTPMGYTGEPTMAMLSGELAAGDSLAINCSHEDILPGMQGYAIVKAGFRHAHGMAFVMNLASGAVDAVHGYVALVIPDPEFGGANADRAAAEGEVLGH